VGRSSFRVGGCRANGGRLHPVKQRPFILFPVGHPAVDAEVPDLRRKPPEELMVWNPLPAEGEADAARPADGSHAPDEPAPG
jgi:hypothetical protein